MEHDDEALVWLRRAAAASPEIPTILAALTSVLALTGQDAEARATLADTLRCLRRGPERSRNGTTCPTTIPRF